MHRLAGIIPFFFCGAPQVEANNPPLVTVLSTGGTIAGRGTSTMSLSEYKAGALLGTELVEAVPEVKQFARVRVEQVCNVASPDIGIEIWRRLAERINTIFAAEVITHGTVLVQQFRGCDVRLDSTLRPHGKHHASAMSRATDMGSRGVGPRFRISLN
jgi:hypothetical protein